jgi:hypothetical protein
MNMATPDMSPLPAIITGLFGLGGALGGALGAQVLAYRHQRQSQRDADARALRDAKRERLGAAFIPILRAAEQYALLARYFNVQTSAAPAPQVQTSLPDAWAALALEGTRADVRPLFEDLERAFAVLVDDVEYLQRQSQRPLPDSAGPTLQEIREAQAGIAEQVEHLKRVMQAHLAELEQPIDTLTAPSWGHRVGQRVTRFWQRLRRHTDAPTPPLALGSPTSTPPMPPQAPGEVGE